MSDAACSPVCAGTMCASDPWPVDLNSSTMPLREVPLLLHQTWKGCELPQPQAAWHQRCQRILSAAGYRIIVWSDKDLRKVVAQHYPSFLGLYDGYDVNIKRVDAARLFLLHRFGGLYMDLDFVCVRPPEIFPPGQVTLVPQAANPNSEEWVSNAWMVAPPRHPFIWRAINSLRRSATASHPLRATGPTFLTGVLRNWQREELFHARRQRSVNASQHLGQHHNLHGILHGPHSSQVNIETVNLGSHNGRQVSKLPPILFTTSAFDTLPLPSSPISAWLRRPPSGTSHVTHP